MRISVIRTGGFTGIPVEISVDESELELDEAVEMHAAIEESRFFSLPTRLPDHSGGADQFSYTITVQDEQNVHTVIASESALPEPLDGFIQRLVRRARRR
jgi:hypothetical protein